MNLLAKLAKPQLLFSRKQFLLGIVATLIATFLVVILFDGLDVFDNEEAFKLSFLIPIYILYFVMIARYNDIDKLKTLIYIFIAGVLFSWAMLAYDLNVGDDETVLYTVFFIIVANLIFGLLLMFYGLFKKGVAIRDSVMVGLPDRIGHIAPEHLKEVKKGHKPDFSQNGLVLFFQGKSRPILSDVDYDMLQPGNLTGARVFEFSLQDVS